MVSRWILPVLGMLLLPAVASAQALEDYDYEHLSFRGIGLDFGYLWPSKVEPAPAYSVRLDLGYLGPGVRIVPSISYWSSRLRLEELERLADQLNRLEPLRQRGVIVSAAELGEIEWSDLSLGVDGHYVWATDGGRIFPYVGAGAGVHAFNGGGRSIADTFIEDLLDSVTAGASGLAGVEVEPLHRLRIYAEARYTLASDVHYPSVRIGGALTVPSRGGAVGYGGGRR